MNKIESIDQIREYVCFHIFQIFELHSFISINFFVKSFRENDKTSFPCTGVIVLTIFTVFTIFAFTLIIVTIVIIFGTRQRLFQQHLQLKSCFIDSLLGIMIDHLLLFFISALLYCIFVLGEEMKMKIKLDQIELEKSKEDWNRNFRNKLNEIKSIFCHTILHHVELCYTVPLYISFTKLHHKTLL